jgi:cyclase
MRRTRVIPVLLIIDGGVYKTTKFADPVYIGDPINTVRLFNDLEVDELVILDIQASKNRVTPDIEFISDIISEAFMPVAYGGGLHSKEQAGRVLRAGVEKVVLNDVNLDSLTVLEHCAKEFGSQSVIAAVDVKKKLFGGYSVYGHVSGKTMEISIREYVDKLIESGAGEIFLTEIDRDGMMKGYDLELISSITSVVDVPVIVCGGAGTLKHMQEAAKMGACALAAGSMFVYKGKQKGVLINYPSENQLRQYLK